MMNVSKQVNMPRYGEVWFADLGVPVGCEQGGKRPVIIVSNDKYNRYSSCVNIVPLTSKDKAKIPTHVEIEDSCLESVSIALVEKYRDIDKARLIKMVGRVNKEIMVEISKAIEIQANMQREFSENKAFEMLSQIKSITRAIKVTGNNNELLSVKEYLIKEYKAYCDRYYVDYRVVAGKYASNSKKVEQNACKIQANAL